VDVDDLMHPCSMPQMKPHNQIFKAKPSENGNTQAQRYPGQPSTAASTQFRDKKS
jgi:hypothetical protein